MSSRNRYLKSTMQGIHIEVTQELCKDDFCCACVLLIFAPTHVFGPLPVYGTIAEAFSTLQSTEVKSFISGIILVRIDSINRILLRVLELLSYYCVSNVVRNKYYQGFSLMS